MPTTYWKSGWNIFDMIVIAASFVDVGVSSIRGLSVIRTFRLVRLQEYSLAGFQFHNSHVLAKIKPASEKRHSMSRVM